MNYIVWDARSSKCISGVFSKEDALQMASSLNQMVFNNTFGGSLPQPSEIKGPFYAHPESRRSVLGK